MPWKPSRAWIPHGTIICMVLLLYARSLNNGFVVWDDDSLVYENPLVTTFSPETLKGIFTSYDPELYIPLTLFTYQMEYALVGPEGWLYHLTNILLHATNGTLVLTMLRRWGLPLSVAFFCAALWAVHPLNSESVLWISARKDTLSACLFLLAYLSYLRFRDDGNRSAYWTSLTTFLLALLSKVSVVFLPVILLADDWRMGRPMDRRTLLEKIPYGVLSAIFLIIALFGKTMNIRALTPWETVLLAVKSTAFSLGMFLAPFRLSSIYHQSDPISLANATFVWSVVIMLLLGTLVVLSLRRTRIVLFAAAFYLLMLAPAFANFSKGGVIYFASDRYSYMAQVGLLLLLGHGLLLLRTSHRVAAMAAATACLAPVFVGTVLARTGAWGDSETLFRDALRKNPRSALLMFNLGTFVQGKGNLDEAYELYTAAIALVPEYSHAWNNLGLIFAERGETDAAYQAYARAVEYDPTNLPARVNLARAEVDRGNAEQALTLLTHIPEYVPGSAQAYMTLATAYGKLERYAEGVRAFQHAWKLDPSLRPSVERMEELLRVMRP